MAASAELSARGGPKLVPVPGTAPEWNRKAQLTRCVAGSFTARYAPRPKADRECDALERRLTLAPIARASFAAAREFETFAHDRDPVETWIARVEHVDGG